MKDLRLCSQFFQIMFRVKSGKNRPKKAVCCFFNKGKTSCFLSSGSGTLRCKNNANRHNMYVQDEMSLKFAIKLCKLVQAF